MHRMTEEEKVAIRLANVVSDLRHDIERVGVYLARVGGNTVNHRLKFIVDTAQEEINGYDGKHTLR